MTQRCLRALVLLALLTLSVLPLPQAQAQTAAPALCFDHDPQIRGPAVPTDPTQSPTAPPAPTGKECPGGLPDDPNYLEGQSVNISIRNFPPSGPPVTVKVYCNNAGSSACHELADTNANYYATLSASKSWAWFPRDFTEPAPGFSTGRNAVTDHAGRYNASWTASAIVGAQDLTRTFKFWLLDAYTSRNATIASGERHEFHASGFEPNSPVQFLVQRRIDDTRWTPVILDPPGPSRADSTGLVFYEWRVPLDEVARANMCPGQHFLDCYEVIVRGSNTTKQEEDVYFHVGAAEIREDIIIGQAPNTQPGSLERTENATIAISFHYPGGDVFNGPEFVPAYLPPGPNNTPRALHVSIVRNASRDAASSTGNGPVIVGDIPLIYAPRRFQWEATWTVPRDLALPPEATFTLRLAEARDLWGNHIAQRDVANYTVSAAKLRPVFVQDVGTLPRTEEGRVALSIKYHNGSVFSDRDNTTPLTGCFVRDGVNACAAAESVTGSFVRDVWVFTKRFPRDYNPLGDHVFVLNGNADNTVTKDASGNTVANITGTKFAVVAGSPHVDFQTIQRGTLATTLERGERISLAAFITYADGKPFNHTVRANPMSQWASVLNVTVTKRGTDDAIQGVDIVPLQEVNTEEGLWVGSIDLSLDVEHTPAGRWSFELLTNDTVSPAPNTNFTSLNRTIIPTPIRFEEVRTTPLSPDAGVGKVITEFKLYYPAAIGQAPQPVSPDVIRSSMVGQVYRWDAKNRTTVGDAVSGTIQPAYSTDRQIWTAEYIVPGSLFNGSYVIAIRGVDTSGNPIQADAWSRAFRPRSPVHDRQIIAQPPSVVERGDSATLLVAARDGDVGPEGAGGPIIRVERWNDDGHVWDPVAGASDVRQPSDLNGHFGVFPITTTTPIGSYHFVFSGREAAPSLALITNTSQNFTVQPTSVTRGILRAPAEKAIKGDIVNFAVERQDGDHIDVVKLLLNGRDSGIAAPILIVEGDHFNASWRIPFEAPNGNYTIHIEGRDVYGNLIDIDVPAIEAVAAQLQGKIIGNPTRIVERGTPAELIFGITYPSGAFYTAGTSLPTVVVSNNTTVVATAGVRREGATYLANWTPPATAGISDYFFEVNGQGIGGNSFPTLRSNAFRLSPGTFERPGANAIPVGTERMATNTYDVPLDPTDKFVSFELGYFGVTADTLSLQGKQPLTRTPLPHLTQEATARYQARFVTDQQTPIGAYRIYMRGEDALGNTITSQSNIFIVKPTTIVIRFDQQPTNDAFKEGATLTISFVATYKSGPLLEERLGHPSVALVLGGSPTNVKPEVTYVNGHWQATIEIPATILDGDYSFAVGGADNAGNQVATARSLTYTVRTNVGTSFAKLVPGPEPMLGVLAIAALALVLGQRRSRGKN